MKKLFISDLKTGDSLFGEVFAVRSYKRGATRNNKPFIDISLADRTGAIKAKIWSDDMANTETVEAGDVVSVNAVVEEFMGAPQLKITNLSRTEKYELTELQQRSKFETEKMWSDIEDAITSIKNPHISKLLTNIFADEDLLARYKYGPAAYVVHHNYMSGLLEHSWEMLSLAKGLKRQYPKINMDLVNAGIILHDIGKTHEFDMETAIVFRDEGKLLGHIYLGAEIVRSHAPKDMPKDLLDEILHIILSHQGEIEHGAVIVPKTTEAVAVYVLDYASTRMNIAYEVLNTHTGTELFTQYVPHLKSELYRSPYVDEDVNEDIPF